MPDITIGIIGCGGISGHHLKSLAELDLPGVEVAAFCDVNINAAEARRNEFGKGDEPVFTSHVDLLDSELVNAVLIATPHPFHPDAAIAAFERGIHVVCEKPVAVTAGEALRINQAHEKSSSVYTVHFQRRHIPKYMWVKEQIDAGLLGRIHKVNVVWTNWYRPQKYYDSGSWRGTWNGEGGGVLMNQCPHDLDLFTWWLGLPETVEAKIWLGRSHNVEIEDEIVATLGFHGGGLGLMNASTCDSPGTARWDILGENGGITILNDNITAFRRDMPLSTYTKTTKEVWAAQPTTSVEVDLPDSTAPIATKGMWANFVKTIRGEEKILMDGTHALEPLELANAVVASGYLGRPVNLPLDPKMYDSVLADLRAGKTGHAII